MIDSLVAANAPQEIIDKFIARVSPEDSNDCEVWEENWESFNFFMALTTQWNVTPMGQCLGISYPSVNSLFDIYAVQPDKRINLFNDVQVMERSVIEFINREKK